MVHAFNPSTWKAEAGEFLSSRPAWSTARTARALQRNPVLKGEKKVFDPRKPPGGSISQGYRGRMRAPVFLLQCESVGNGFLKRLFCLIKTH